MFDNVYDYDVMPPKKQRNYKTMEYAWTTKYEMSDTKTTQT